MDKTLSNLKRKWESDPNKENAQRYFSYLSRLDGSHYVFSHGSKMVGSVFVPDLYVFSNNSKFHNCSFGNVFVKGNGNVFVGSEINMLTIEGINTILSNCSVKKSPIDAGQGTLMSGSTFQAGIIFSQEGITI
jgi:hypothetical protein